MDYIFVKKNFLSVSMVNQGLGFRVEDRGVYHVAGKVKVVGLRPGTGKI